MPLECHDAADRLATFQGGEAVVDLVERNVPRDQLVDLQFPLEIEPRQQREVARRPGPAKLDRRMRFSAISAPQRNDTS